MSLRRPRGRIVYSTDPRPDDESPPQAKPPQKAAPGGQTVYVERDRKRRRGKTVTVVSGLPGSEDSLRDLLNQSLSGLGPQKTAFFLREIAKGLAYLHDRGIVHRDLKPGNIFYEDGYVKIGD